MVSKGNHFQQNRAMQQQQRSNVRAAIAPYRKPFRPQTQVQAPNQMMYSSCQMPSDPLYIDFNCPTPAPPTKPQVQAGNSISGPGQADGSKKKPLKGKQVKGNKQQHQHQQQHHHPHNMPYAPQMHMQMHGNNGWVPRFHPPNGKRFDEPMSLPNRGRAQMGGPSNRGGGRHMMGPMGPGPGPMGPRGGGLCPNGGGPMPPYPPMRFPQPMPPMRCPMPPMGGPPPPPFMRRNGRGGPPLPPPLMGPHMMGPRMPPRGMPPVGPVPYNMGHMNGNMNGGKIKKPNPKLIKQVVKGKSTIKTLKNLVNQYPIDKPWVNDDIRAVHDTKLDIENRLKGNKDDELFAQYRVQRDKFVSMYETARETYLKQEAATIKAKDAKDIEKNANVNANVNAVAKVEKTNDATIPTRPSKNQNVNELSANNAATVTVGGDN